MARSSSPEYSVSPVRESTDSRCGLRCPRKKQSIRAEAIKPDRFAMLESWIAMQPYDVQRIENWVGDFCSSDAIRPFPPAVREHSPAVLVRFLVAACEERGIEPGDVEESDLKAALLGPVAKLNLPSPVKSKVPALCGALLGHLESEGRLSGGRMLGAYVRALNEAFEEAASGKIKPIVRPGSRLNRNDPCPCGSGKKYKKCCMNE